MAFTAALEITPDEGPGLRVGNYELLQKIGEGGFSTVWLADQSEPVRRKVAVKIIKRGMDTEEVITRFETERQALALMDHPHIARVFDAGSTESGRPFFVMELVRGVPITRYCDENRLSAEGRLRLFISVCHAVQHAHQKGVIHRDLKPSNILVTLYDGVPVPKIIDFGIAKAAGVRLTEKTFVTQFHAFLGTPAYTSPEQMEMSGLDVDTRSDLYSLGVLLYELLCGCLPFDADTLANAGLVEMRRAICEIDPPRPSSRLATLPLGQRSTLAQQRGTDGARLSLLLRGDLDWIVMRCLEKDRRRRYASATELADDLEHHLANEPVRARPPSRVYLLQKSLRRHRVAFAAAGVIALVLVLGAAVSTWQAIRATRAEQEQTRLHGVESVLRQRAEDLALTLRHRAYASDMNGVQVALAKDNLGRALELLNRQRPKPGESDLRGWEWRYLWQFCQDESASVLNDKPLLAAQLAVSADGNWLAMVHHEDAAVELWNLRTREHRPVPLPPGTSEVLVAFSPTEPLLALHFSPTQDTPGLARLLLWNYDTQQTVREWTVQLQSRWRHCPLVFSADGKKLLLALGASPTILSVADGCPLLTLPAKAGYQLWAISPDFSRAAIEIEDTSIQLWDIASGKAIWKAKVAAEYVNAVAFSADGRLLATAGGGAETAIRLWDAATGNPLGNLDGHHQPVQCLVFLPGGQTLVSGAHDQTIRLWDIDSPKPVRTLRGHQQGLFALVLLPDGKTLASSARDGSVRLWDASVSTPHPYRLIEGPVLRWKFAPDSQSIVTVDGSGKVCRWHGRGFAERDELADVGPVANSYVTNGMMIGWPMYACLAADVPLVAITKPNQVVQVWNWKNKTMVHEITTTGGPILTASTVAFGDGGRKLLMNWVSADGKSRGLYEWDLSTGKPTRSWPYSHKGDWAYSTVSADHRRGLFGWGKNPFTGRRNENPASLIDLETGLERQLPGAGLWWWDNVSFSPDGQLLAVPGGPASTIWQLQPFQLHKSLPPGSTAAFSPDGRRLGFAGGPMWDTTSWEQVLELEAPRGNFFGSVFSPDGNVFAAWTQFNELHLWRAPSWAEIAAAETARDYDER